MHVPIPHAASFRILRRDGAVWRYPNLAAACADLVAGGLYRHGMLSDEVVDAFTSSIPPGGGPSTPHGTYVVETHDGRRLGRGEIRDACAGPGRRRNPRRSRWNHRPACRHRMTKADRRAALADRQDLAELGYHPDALVAPMPGLDDPYEHHPRRRPERSWKRHRAHRWR